MAKEVLVVRSKVKDYVKGKGLNSAGDVADSASDQVYKLLDAAIARAKANGRKTLRGSDF